MSTEHTKPEEPADGGESQETAVAGEELSPEDVAALQALGIPDPVDVDREITQMYPGQNVYAATTQLNGLMRKYKGRNWASMKKICQQYPPAAAWRQKHCDDGKSGA